ncbi:MAG: dehydrogenase [Chloroflexi bacterium]|nr:dehydrogenase [Chloroflexota bacterium]
MAEVNNWQIGRTMEYPYPENRPRRQIAWIFDPNKCIGCQTCTIACKSTWTWGTGQEYMLWNNVESKPFGFFPVGWDVELMNAMGPAKWNGGRYEGETIFEGLPPTERVRGWLPDEEDWAFPNIGEDEVSAPVKQGDYFPDLPHGTWFYHLARICNHCTYPGCIAACPRQAIYKRPEDGIVLVDQERCRGYQECAQGCPYKKVMFNNNTRTTEKCIACFPKVEQGLQPQCVTSCIGRIRLAGFISPPGQVNPQNPIDYLVKVRKVALPMYPQAGTEPNVYYIPPIHAGREYLRQMFGPGVDDAITTYANTKNDPELLGVFTLFGSAERIMHRFRIDGEIAIGMDENGAEIVRVPVREPSWVRTYFDEVRQAYNHNIT